MKKSFSHLAFVCLFVILPAMLTSMFVNEFFEHEKKLYYDKQFDSLNHSLSETLYNLQSEVFLLKKSKKIFEYFKKNKSNKAKIETYCKELADDLPVEFDFIRAIQSSLAMQNKKAQRGNKNIHQPDKQSVCPPRDKRECTSAERRCVSFCQSA
jgi:hypothetical protein